MAANDATPASSYVSRSVATEVVRLAVLRDIGPNNPSGPVYGQTVVSKAISVAQDTETVASAAS